MGETETMLGGRRHSGALGKLFIQVDVECICEKKWFFKLFGLSFRL